MEDRVTESIRWVGVHFPEPPPGAALNAYLIQDDKTAVIDTTAPATAPRVLENIRALVDPTEIDYIVLTHTDLDHAGGLALLLEAAPQATVLVSEFEAKALPLWGVRASVQITKEGDVISLGGHSLRFIQSPHICTPGHQLIFEESEGVLFSGDLFAQIGPQEWQMFADVDCSQVLRTVQYVKLGETKYPQEAIAKVRDLDVNVIASGHGHLLRERIPEYMACLSA
jgi:NADH oxidase (H2O-forming)